MFIKLYCIALPVFFAIDMIWLGYIANNIYRAQVGTLLKTDVNWVAAIIFYLIFIGGLVFFAIEPAVQKQSWTTALLLGALFGFMTYATYDLTNLATLKNWTLTITIIDLLWGTVLGMLVSGITYYISTKI